MYIYGINTTNQNRIEMYPAIVDPVEDVQVILDFELD